MPKLIVLRGLPGCGMTLQTFNQMTNDDSLERMSKKDRFATFVYQRPSRTLVKQLLRYFHTELKQKMSKGENIIVDDLNLNPYHHYFYTKMASLYNYTVEFKFLESSIKDCTDHIAIKRKEKIALPSFMLSSEQEVIELAEKYGLCREEIRKIQEKNKENTKKDNDCGYSEEFVVYGLDDCLANVEERRDFAITSKGFDENCFNKQHLIGLDEPYYDVFQMLQNDFSTGYKIVIITNRKEELRNATEAWLLDHNIDYHHLIMRSAYQTVSEHMYKLFVVQKKFGLGMCMKIVDDNPEVIKQFENFSIPGALIERDKDRSAQSKSREDAEQKANQAIASKTETTETFART